jgi:hypothetical protein
MLILRVQRGLVQKDVPLRGRTTGFASRTSRTQRAENFHPCGLLIAAVVIPRDQPLAHGVDWNERLPSAMETVKSEPVSPEETRVLSVCPAEASELSN